MQVFQFRKGRCFNIKYNWPSDHLYVLFDQIVLLKFKLAGDRLESKLNHSSFRLMTLYLKRLKTALNFKLFLIGEDPTYTRFTC